MVFHFDNLCCRTIGVRREFSISSLSRVKKAPTLRKTLESVFLIFTQVSRRITYERFLKVISFQNEISEPKIYCSSEIVFESNMGVGGVLSLLWFQKRLPDYAAKKRLKFKILQGLFFVYEI